ncbi:MAG: polyisoprenoid-binding protein YceI [Polyangiales bacterium]|jgi:polyisoprenoid-binding protein YceI
MRARSQFASLILGGAILGTSLAGCDDPADDVAAATVRPSEPAGESPEATPAAENVATETLRFSNEGSAIGFVGSKVTGSHEGGFNEFAGTVEFNLADATASQIEVTIQTASLFADDERLTGHLKDEDFFNVEAIPTATFRSTSIAAVGEGAATHTITGALTLHGQENTISFPATVVVGDAAVTATAEFSINRSEFGMSYPGMEDNLIRERVVIKLEIRAPRS